MINFLKIKKNRLAKKIKANQLSKVVGISKNYYSEIENGIRLNPNKGYIDKICEILELDCKVLELPFNNISVKIKNKYSKVKKTNILNGYKIEYIFNAYNLLYDYTLNNDNFSVIDNILFYKDEYESIISGYENWKNSFNDIISIIELPKIIYSDKIKNINVVYFIVHPAIIVTSKNNEIAIETYLKNIPIQDHYNIYFQLLINANKDKNVIKAFGENAIVKYIKNKMDKMDSFNKQIFEEFVKVWI